MIQRHPIYWFDDADTILFHESTLYKIHSSRLSVPKFLSEFSQTLIPDDVLNILLADHNNKSNLHGCSYVRLDSIYTSDLVDLLDHFYGPNQK